MCEQRGLGILARLAGNAQATSINAPAQPKRPSWENICYGYPTKYNRDYLNIVANIFSNNFKSIRMQLTSIQSADDFGRAIGYNGTLDNEDASAARVSIAITTSSRMHLSLEEEAKGEVTNSEELFRIDDSNIAGNESILKGYVFIAKVNRLFKWLSKVWGNPKIIERPQNLESVSTEIKNVFGVCIMSTCIKPKKIGGELTIDGDRGYATLWTGNNVVGGRRYINANCTVYFWELCGEPLNKCGICHIKNDVCSAITRDDCNCEEYIKEIPIHKALGCCHYMEIRKKIDVASTSKEIDVVGIMLRGLWDKYEKELVIHDFGYNGDRSMFTTVRESTAIEYNVFSRHITDSSASTPGILINIEDVEYGLAGSDKLAIKEYQVIIHELFHNVDYLAVRTVYSEVV